jgi:hypothetical protein
MEAIKNQSEEFHELLMSWRRKSELWPYIKEHYFDENGTKPDIEEHVINPCAKYLDEDYSNMIIDCAISLGYVKEAEAAGDVNGLESLTVKNGPVNFLLFEGGYR